MRRRCRYMFVSGSTTKTPDIPRFYSKLDCIGVNKSTCIHHHPACDIGTTCRSLTDYDRGIVEYWRFFQTWGTLKSSSIGLSTMTSQSRKTIRENFLELTNCDLYHKRRYHRELKNCDFPKKFLPMVFFKNGLKVVLNLIDRDLKVTQSIFLLILLLTSLPCRCTMLPISSNKSSLIGINASTS